MYTVSGTVIIEPVVRFSPVTDGVDFVDLSETRFHLSMKDLVRLYEGCKHNVEKRGLSWKQFCDDLFEEKVNENSSNN